MRTIAAYSVSDDQAHVELINGVEHDDAVRGLCRHDKIASIAEVDFEGVKELDFFLPPSLQWWPPLKMGCLSPMAQAQHSWYLSVLLFFSISRLQFKTWKDLAVDEVLA
jgi:hypothetical protein